MDKKYFPIRTATSCQLKWNWTALYLHNGISRTCHRTSETKLTPENFQNFHNTEIVLDDRRRMLQGQWPNENCSYCRKIEQAGGVSDRLRQIDIPNLYPPELDNDPNALVVDPTIIEIYFNNTCNLGCLYCSPFFSSTLNSENHKFGEFNKNGVVLQPIQTHTKNLSPFFWKWFPTGFPKLKRLHMVGGEPLYQKELDTLLDMIDQYPNPDCEFNIITNLMAPTERIEGLVEKLRTLLLKRKIRRVDISCSIDCFGPEQEYVRYGLNIDHWKKNFDIFLKNKWIYLNINSTITVLTIKTIPDLLIWLNGIRKDRKVHYHFSGPAPGPSYFNAGILGKEEFSDDFRKILKLMPRDTNEDQVTYQYMEGLANFITTSERDPVEIKKLFTFLDEMDRRRSTSWKELFPWLERYQQYVV